MFGPAGEMVAYGIIGVLTLGGAVTYALGAKRRRRQKLRRRGIKTHGH